VGSGLITGTPTTAGTSSVTVTVSDGRGGTDSETFAWSIAADTLAPSQPTGLSVSSVNGTPVLTWGASTDNVRVTGYRIHRSTDGTFGSAIAQSVTTTWTDSTAQENVRYTYAVVAFDAAGNSSVRSSLASITAGAPPTAPTGLTAAYVSGAVRLNWSPSTDNIGVAGYIVYRSSTGSQGSEIARTTTPGYADATVVRRTKYTYSVRAYDAAGLVSDRSNFASIKTP